MPLSKNRRKNGKKIIRGRHARRQARDAEIRAINQKPITLQDLINVVAYQDAHNIKNEEKSDIDFEDPKAQAVIQAVHDAKNNKIAEETQDGR